MIKNIDSSTTKICSKCKKIKNLQEDFYKGKGFKDGYMSYCKDCRKNFPSVTPEAKLEQVRALRQRNREFMWEYYKTHPCVDCGEADPIVLEPDHVRGDKLANVAKLVHNTRSLKVIKEELSKCEIVCSNCHKRRTAKQQGWYIGLK